MGWVGEGERVRKEGVGDSYFWFFNFVISMKQIYKSMQFLKS